MSFKSFFEKHKKVILGTAGAVAVGAMYDILDYLCFTPQCSCFSQQKKLL